MGRRRVDATEEQHEPEPVADIVEPAAAYDHKTLHGADSVVSDERAYYIRIAGQRYVHVGDTPDGRWVYRPD